MPSPTQQKPAAGPSTDELRQLRRQALVGQALRDVAGALGATLELDALLELVVSRIAELTLAKRVVLFVLDERSRTLEGQASNHAEDCPISIPLGEGWLAHVARSGQAVRFSGVGADERQREWQGGLSHGDRQKSGLAAAGHAAALCPLKNNLGRTIGVVLALDKAGRPSFDDDDEEILSLFAKQAAVAIDNSRLLLTLIRKNQQLQQAQVQLTRRVRDLELLFELERRTAHAHSMADLARAVLSSLARSCNAQGAVLVMAEESEGAFTEFRLLLTARGNSPSAETTAEFRSASYSPNEALLGPVIRLGTPLQLDAATEALEHPGIGEVRSVIAEPLDGEESPLGALALLNKRGGPFTAEDLGLLRLVSANVSTAVRLFNSNRSREREERLTSIGRLLSQVVHDLKSPLTVISGYVQLMEESADRKERARYAQEILKQFQALGAMEREVLAFARGETKVFVRKVIVDRFFEDLKQRLETELDGYGVELRLTTTPKLVAHFDSEKIMRVLQNLVRNAAEAMNERGGGRVSISAAMIGDELSLEVRDNGPGIPEEIASRLFLSFVTAGKKGGTGLGLAIVKRIVVEHGGSIALVPVPVGSCFRILLPQRDEPAPLSIAAGPMNSGRPPSPRATVEPAEPPGAPKKNPRSRGKELADKPSVSAAPGSASKVGRASRSARSGGASVSRQAEGRRAPRRKGAPKKP